MQRIESRIIVCRSFITTGEYTFDRCKRLLSLAHRRFKPTSRDFGVSVWPPRSPEMSETASWREALNARARPNDAQRHLTLNHY